MIKQVLRSSFFKSPNFLKVSRPLTTNSNKLFFRPFSSYDGILNLTAQDFSNSKPSSSFLTNIENNVNSILNSVKKSSEIKLENGDTAKIYTRSSYTPKDLEDLKEALLFVLTKTVEFKETKIGVAQSELSNGIIAEVRDGGIESHTKVKVFRNDHSLVLQINEGWLKNWQLKK